MSFRVGALPGVPLSLWVPVSPPHPLSVNVWLCGSSLSPCSFIFLSPSGFLFLSFASSYSQPTPLFPLCTPTLEPSSPYFYTTWASLVAQRLKRLPAMQETWVRSLGQEESLEKEMAPYSSILAWRIPWMEEPSGLQSIGSQRVGHD